MKKKYQFRNPLTAGLLLMLLFAACYEFDWVVQPECVPVNSSFEADICILTTDGNGGYYTPCFGIRLPQGWTVPLSIEFRYGEADWYPWSMEGEGFFMYSDSLAAVMDSIDPPGVDYYWWVGSSIDSVPYNWNYLFRISPVINTDGQAGTFYLDYMAGDNTDGLYGGGINYARYDSVPITTLVPDTLMVTSASDAGAGSLRKAIEQAGCGDHIYFDIQTTDTVFLSGPLVIDKNLHISGPQEGNITISGQSGTQIFNVSKHCRPVLKNLNLVNGYAVSGGAIFIDSLAIPTLENISIRNCMATANGGAVYCETDSHLHLSNTTIAGNAALLAGGGIYWNSGARCTMDTEHRSNIYFNLARYGNDLFHFSLSSIPTHHVVLDTFSLLLPNTDQVYFLDHFTFDILNGKGQTVNADLYVSPEGNNNNTGLTPGEPLKNIDLALSLLEHDPVNPKTIHLSEGLYSFTQTHEIFPIALDSARNLSGTSKELVILDAEGSDGITFNWDNHLSNLTLTGGSRGLSIWNFSPVIENVIIKNCTDNGVIGYNTSARFLNIIIENNSALNYGGGFRFMDSDPVLINVLATGNQAYKGGAISSEASHLTLINSTLANNSSTLSTGGAGIYADDGSEISVMNSILYNNFPEEIVLQGVYEPNHLDIAYSTLRGGTDGIYISGSSTFSWLEGNKFLDPQFDGGSMIPYQLSELSPCIDAGTPDTTGLGLPCWDLINNKRCWDGDGDGAVVVDMGAFEYGSLAVGTGDVVQSSRLKVEGYPNPVAGDYYIAVTLDRPAQVSWDVWDILGNKVAGAVAVGLPAGEQTLKWDTRDLKPGIYCLCVRSGNEVRSVKVVKQ